MFNSFDIEVTECFMFFSLDHNISFEGLLGGACPNSLRGGVLPPETESRTVHQERQEAY